MLHIARRSVFRLIAASAACPLCASIVRAEEPHAGGPPHWGYTGENGPAHWGELSADFKTCEFGLAQTPIDLRETVHHGGDKVAVAFQPMQPRIVNNGHTIQVNCPPGLHSTIGETDYQLLQFHFHHPSEHLLAGKRFDLECHFVHKAASGALAVLGIFVVPGATNQVLAPLWQMMPAHEGPEVTGTGTIDPSGLLPKDRDAFRYAGSLSTPPCSEGITWTVFRDAITASPEQIRQFAALFPNNARPVQQMNRRELLELGA